MPRSQFPVAHSAFRSHSSRCARALVAWLLLAAQLAAATRTYLAQAGAVPQIDSITVGGTWAAGDTASVTLGNSTLTLTLGSTTTATADIATALKNAINATTLDGSLAGNEKRNAAGQLLGEFRDVDAVIDSASTSVVLVRSKVAGVPFGTPSGGNMTVAKSSASGTLTRGSVQAATGPWHWNNTANWSGGAVPANDDVVVFMDTAAGPKFGLPNGSLEVTFQVYQTFTGEIGLRLLNANGYTEYRQRYVRLDDSGTGSDIAHRFGLGQAGSGSPLVNLSHSAVKCSPVVFTTGTPTGGYALNLCCAQNTSTLNILGGSVDYSSQDGSTAAIATLTQTGGSSRGIGGLKAGADVKFHGGAGIVGGTLAINSLAARGGTLRVENQTGTTGDISIYSGASVDYASTGTITALLIDGGTFDARGNTGGFSVGTASLYNGPKFYDPYKRMTITGSLTIYGELSTTLLFGGSSTDGILITP